MLISNWYHTCLGLMAEAFKGAYRNFIALEIQCKLAV